MRRFSPWLVALIAGGATAAVLTGCAQKSPDERVAEARGEYTATLNTFVVKQEPAADEAATAAEPQTDMGGSEPAEPAAAAEPAKADIVLDIMLSHRGEHTLPGLTLDVSQADATGKEKNHWKIWIDTSDLLANTGKPIAYTLKQVDYQEGDGFHVEVRPNVPSAEKSEYHEFALHS